MEAEPGELGVFGVTLLGPCFGGMQRWPMRVVEVRMRPPGIVTEMEAPSGINLGDGKAGGVQIESLRAVRGWASRAESDHKDSQQPRL